MDEELYFDDTAEDDGDEFVAFVARMSEANRKLHIRREIERREESRRLSESLGLDDLKLGEAC